MPETWALPDYSSMNIDTLTKIIYHLEEASNLIYDGTRSSNQNKRLTLREIRNSLVSYMRIFADDLHYEEKKKLEDWKKGNNSKGE